MWSSISQNSYLSQNTASLNVSVKWLALLPHIREVSGSILFQATYPDIFPGLHQSFKDRALKYSRRSFIRKYKHRKHPNNVIIEGRFGIAVPKATTTVRNFLTTCAVVDGS
jgi:hypothetical protein